MMECSEMRHDGEDIHRIVYGDGTTRGLLERLASLETEIEHLRAAVDALAREISEDRAAMRAFATRVAWAAVTAAIGVLSQVAFVALSWHRG
jgi:alkylation response protein AidB-like acyl-CoA dehydrogenase